MPSRFPIGLNKILLVLAVVVACSGIFFGLFSLRQPKSTTKAIKLPSVVIDYTTEIENSIRTAFASPLYHGVMDYLDLALSEKEINSQYDYYIKAYSQMSQIYHQDRKPEQLQALYLLREYLKSFPQFRDQDVAIE